MDDSHLFKKFDPQGTGQLEFKNPGLDTEDGGDTHMPNKYRCDSCRILSMMITNMLQEKIGTVDRVPFH